MSGAEIKAAREAVYAARKKLRRLVSRTYPVGSAITYQRGRGQQDGKVLMHGSGDEGLKVRNFRTGKEYWISAYDIEGAGL